MLEKLISLSAKDFFGLSVLGAFVSSFGTLIGLVLKEHLFARSFESWKSRRVLNALFEKYRDPLVLAADELSIRVTVHPLARDSSATVGPIG